MAAKKQTGLPKQVFDYLEALKENNNREWFESNRLTYQGILSMVETFADELLAQMNTFDVIETPSGKASLFRIYRDVRFSKDKSPYKIHWAGRFKRATKFRRGGYYFELEPGNTILAGGFRNPNADDLKKIRDDIAFDPGPLQAILKDRKFVATFGALQGEQLKVVPRGYERDHPAGDLLKYKQFLLIRKFTDEEVLDKGFVIAAARTFQQMSGFFDYMSSVLVADSNGELS
ncbi:DUF2461 domain-containing protein [Chitinophaga agrisoli]|uniref:DUF2461 domain-containing protein n=1 Tax=Chitinophaga agrisoli TaxID=2607653 RepID=A0A5B2VNR7_9BACT|nr:DUF2461 domain-containing protein [Chitinophaga agrisoli]KAA2241323.1 DUF2461 domain-containing protein [Chitinophaga agrisoli]